MLTDGMKKSLARRTCPMIHSRDHPNRLGIDLGMILCTWGLGLAYSNSRTSNLDPPGGIFALVQKGT